MKLFIVQHHRPGGVRRLVDDAIALDRHGALSVRDGIDARFYDDLARQTRKLVDAFLDMALTCARYERYLDTVDLNQLDRQQQRFTARAASKNTPDAERTLAKKNAAVIDKRMEKLRDIRNYLGVAKGQLDLIENSFQLIADQIVTMQSPNELSGQLDDLLDGVDSIRQTAIDTEKLLSNGMETA